MFDNEIFPPGLGTARGGSAREAFDAMSLTCVWRFSAIGLLLSLGAIFGTPTVALGISMALAGALLVIVGIWLGFAVAARDAGVPQ